MDMITTLFLIGSSANLQVTRTAIKSWTSSNSGHIFPFTLELPALKHIFFGATCPKLLEKSLSGHASQLSNCCPLGYLFFVL